MDNNQDYQPQQPPQYQQPQYQQPQPQYPQQPVQETSAPPKKKRSLLGWIVVILVGIAILAMTMGW